MNKLRIAQTGVAESCYFRTTVEPPYKKALIKVTDRCNLKCAHCFVSAGLKGDSMCFDSIRSTLIPRLVDMKVISATLTGGEPFAHPDIMEIVSELRKNELAVSLCTNATLLTDKQIDELTSMGGVTANVSLDGFRKESHGKFRGNIESFDTTVSTIRKLAQKGLLKGLLVTPNKFASIEEYVDICNFAIENGAKYVLMNPLSSFGRGVKSKKKLESPMNMMKEIKNMTQIFNDQVELVPIRFPNDELPLAGCHAGSILYIFTNGDISACAYLSFAAGNPGSKHKPSEFIIANIFNDPDAVEKVANYNFHDKYTLGSNDKCGSCSIGSACGKGCPAAVIASGQKIEGVDREQCPK